MSHFIIIRGAAGVGKSTITKELAEITTAKVYQYDQIMKSLGFNFIQGEKWIPLHKYLEADKVMIPKFQKELAENVSLIFDGNFYHYEQIDQLIKQLNCPHYIFTLKANLEECIKRNKTRIGKLADAAVKEVFEITKDQNYGIIIETDNKTTQEVVEEIIKQIN
ncbi:AAA family ATPase [Candidatus Woesearchaeota archaeon]|jgi:tRNA uridine 5-carbamoylmethylation protein Kti12|nr:AAA family ATPase [Candidatus Woesearchaeota archaeon]